MNDSGYRIELGLLPERPVAGRYESVAVNLENATTGGRVGNLGAWVRISGGDGAIVFSSTGMRANSEGYIPASVTFPSAGDYEILARFDAPDGLRPQGVFIVKVAENRGSSAENGSRQNVQSANPSSGAPAKPDSRPAPNWAYAIAGFAMGASAVIALRNLRGALKGRRRIG